MVGFSKGSCVARLDDYRRDPHNSASVKCISCGHEWVAVIPSPRPMVHLECTNCGCDGGMKQGTVEMPGKNVWECNCGSQAFAIYENIGAFCINCGQVQSW